ncbi:Peflin [Armadillidium nasatum]|uniref:Peflin n=1 Tax=Armadillidium nasatum TaxID=96803 RepID=A0A5N5SRU7_9CRUS|nr:Peflin [Armadillidium nasatum]
MSYNPSFRPQNSMYGYAAQQHQGYAGQAPVSGYPQQYVYVTQAQQQVYPGQTLHQSHPGTQQMYQTSVHQSYGAPPGVDPTIMSWFKAVDQDNSGQINARELSLALQNGNNSNFSDEACKLMISMFDTDHSGTINVQEFSQLFGYINQWTDVYKRFDQDKSGTIDERELEVALQQMGYRLSPQFVSYLVNKFDRKTRKVSLDNFIVANVQLHRLTDAFKKKDVEMKGLATFGYEEFVTLALSV